MGWRYRYLGDRMTDPALRGMRCRPVRRPDGKCLVGRGMAVVIMEDGVVRGVSRRRLRLTDESRAAPWLKQ